MSYTKHDFAEMLPSYIKTPVGFLRSERVRKRVFRERKIKKKQDEAIRKFDPTAKKLIVFLVPGADRTTGADKISGGIMSIVSLCQESAGLKDIHQSEVIMCTMRDEHLLFGHSQFVNHTDVFRYSQLSNYFTAAEEVIFHLPEFVCEYFLRHLTRADKHWIAGLRHVHINILNQNIRLMPSREVIQRLEKLASKVTATTAHQKYCNERYRREQGIPLHKFSVWISPEKYTFRNYAEKENLIVVSPDIKPLKQAVLDKLSTIPGLRIQVIQNLTYEKYKETIARAKWALTFGEGLDGYIIEPIFSGAIGFAVYNEEFFTPDFQPLPTIYASYERLLERISDDIRRLDDADKFVACQKEQFALCARYYSYDHYLANIKAFYKGQYSLP
jgi:hypothetical protein